VHDRATRRTVVLKPLRGFAAYKKLIQISHLTLDKTFYNFGEPIQCQVTLENLTDAELPRQEEHVRILDWQEHEGWNE
jgi:hypothetical protein